MIQTLDTDIIFRDIEGFAGYKVSNVGTVMNVQTGLILKPSKRTDGYYKVNLYQHGRQTNKAIHRLVAKAFIENTEGKPCVDHINHELTDNRLENLRFATHSENSMNSTKRNTNTSGHIGVGWHKGSNTWHARITFNNKKVHIGSFKTIEAAIAARQAAEIIHFGEFRLNAHTDYNTNFTDTL